MNDQPSESLGYNPLSVKLLLLIAAPPRTAASPSRSPAGPSLVCCVAHQVCNETSCHRKREACYPLPRNLSPARANTDPSKRRPPEVNHHAARTQIINHLALISRTTQSFTLHVHAHGMCMCMCMYCTRKVGGRTTEYALLDARPVARSCMLRSCAP